MKLYTSEALLKSGCPICLKPLNSITSLVAENAREPMAGDFTICRHCTSFLIFNSDLGIRLLEPEEVAAMPAHSRAALVRAREFYQSEPEPEDVD